MAVVDGDAGNCKKVVLPDKGQVRARVSYDDGVPLVEKRVDSCLKVLLESPVETGTAPALGDVQIPLYALAGVRPEKDPVAGEALRRLGQALYEGVACGEVDDAPR